jgi:sugar/nucleoside kinase (ribokinase family)
MIDLVVAGMAYLDVFVPPHRRPSAGEERFVDGIALGMGGAFNTASVAAGLGLGVTLCVPAGRGIADLAAVALAQRLGIGFEALPARDDPAISLVFSGGGERSFLSSSDFAALDRVRALPLARWIHVAGLEEAARLAAPLARARASGALVAVSGSWNPARLAQLAAATDCPWDLLVLNEHEARTACGDATAAIGRLAGKAARSLIVTLGAAGAAGIVDGVAVHQAGATTEVCDSTGAGDAFCGALLAALMRGAPAALAVQHANRAAAYILKQRGGLLDGPAQAAAMAKEMEWKY